RRGVLARSPSRGRGRSAAKDGGDVRRGGRADGDRRLRPRGAVRRLPAPDRAGVLVHGPGPFGRRRDPWAPDLAPERGGDRRLPIGFGRRHLAPGRSVVPAARRGVHGRRFGAVRGAVVAGGRGARTL